MNRSLPLIALAAAGLVTLSACGSHPSGSATDRSGQQDTGGYGSGKGGPSGRGFPGAVGKIAARSGRTLQVQGEDGQTAVTYTSKTAITADVAGSVKDLKVGTCVVVIPAPGASSSAATGSGQTVTAGTVRVTPKTNGSCDAGRGFGDRGSGRGGPSGGPSVFPSGLPSGMPSDRARGRAFGTAGEVTATTGSGFTVKARTPGSDGSMSTTSVVVTVTAATEVVATKRATATALKVGTCVTASGRTDDTGAVTADRISVSDAVNGECTSGFVRRDGGKGQ